MGRYINWDDVVDRYPEVNTLGGADEIGSAYIAYAETFVDGMLASHFTPPFSDNNLTVKDLAIDCVFFRAARFKNENATEVKSDFFSKIKMLKGGDLSMVTDSGDVIAIGAQSVSAFSTTQSYHSSFGIDEAVNWQVDSSHIDDVQDSRL